jgi:tRNA(Ile)-lysidine synthase
VDLLLALERFFAAEAPLAEGDRLVVAFSGGPDSTALLLGLARLAARRPFSLAAAHLDHGLDRGSAGRAEAARRLAGQIGVPFLAERREVPRLRRPGESPEEAARRIRYAFLEEGRRRLGARYVATAHHADDQAETALLRLLAGSGLAGLGGIRPRHGRVVRPLLGFTRSELAATLAGSGLRPSADPTNGDLERARNRVRHRLLPALARSDHEASRRLVRLAAACRGASRRIEELLATALSPVEVDGGVAIARQAFLGLPAPLRPHALALLHRRVGAPYPPSAAAAEELLRQLAQGRRVGCDAGRGLRWEGRRGLLVLAPGGRRVEGFSYTLDVPAEVETSQAGESSLAARVVECRGAAGGFGH